MSSRLPRGEAAAVLEILKPSLVVGGEADWNAPISLPVNFVPEGFSDAPLTAPIARYWKAMTSGGSTGRPKVILDHQPAVTDTSAQPPLCIPKAAAVLNPGPLYHNAPFIACHFALFAGGHLTGMIKFDAEETLRLIEAQRVQWVNFVPTMMHRIWSLPPSVRKAYDLSSLKVVFHMAAPMPQWLKEEWITWLGPEKIYELYGGTERQGRCVISGVEWLKHKGSVGKIDESCSLRIIGPDVVRGSPAYLSRSAKASFFASTKTWILWASLMARMSNCSGGIHAGNVGAYALAGANIVVTSSPYLARPRDVQVRIGPASGHH